MKKALSCILIAALCLAFSGCTKQKQVEVPENIVNPITVTISAVDSDSDEVEATDFVPVERTSFIVEEGTNLLDATQIFCLSEDIEISLDSAGTYVTSIGGLGEKDIETTTGWVFTLNGETVNKGATDVVLADGDEISWEFVDFTTYTW